MNDLVKLLSACGVTGAVSIGGATGVSQELYEEKFASKDDLIATQQATIENQQRIIDAQGALTEFRCETLKTTANDYVGKVVQSERNVRFYDTRLDDLPEDAPREMRDLLVDAQQQAAVLLRLQEDTKAGIIESLDQNCR